MKVDELVISRKSLENVIPARPPQSSKSNYFWMPDQVRHDGFGTFYELIDLQFSFFTAVHLFYDITKLLVNRLSTEF